jgi:hypothetical protein
MHGGLYMSNSSSAIRFGIIALASPHLAMPKAVFGQPKLKQIDHKVGTNSRDIGIYIALIATIRTFGSSKRWVQN